MKRIRLVVAYDGTAYCGWQIQANGRTVEEMLNKALSRITGEDIHVQGASRTDAGVHALAQYVSVPVDGSELNLPAARLTRSLVALTPDDISIRGLYRAPLGFSAGLEGQNRFDAVRRAVLSEVRRTFRPELLNRLDDMIASTGLPSCKLCTYCWNGKT